jgi:alpha-methylacyl-CoA racemase
MGPLQGVKVLEIGGIGPGPFCGMLLSDMGADVVRVERKQQFKRIRPQHDVLTRNRRSIVIDLKSETGIETVLRMVEQVDALQEGFRPGVMEQLGLGPDICLERNPRLVYGRMTGWGQDGPLSQAAGHDINYIALSGVLHAIGRPDARPVVPLNLIGDFGGGGMLLAFGMVCALLEARKSEKGQVVDAAIVDGAATMMAMNCGLKASGLWSDRRGRNLLDGGAHFYDTYETKDRKYIAVGSIEPAFYNLLRQKAELTDPAFDDQMDQRNWPEMKNRLKEIFKRKTRDQWCALLEGTDACFAPVLSLDEAAEHPHNLHRKAFSRIEGLLQPAPAPRFSRTRPEIKNRPPFPGEHTDSVLAEFGFAAEEINEMITDGVVSVRGKGVPRD